MKRIVLLTIILVFSSLIFAMCGEEVSSVSDTSRGDGGGGDGDNGNNQAVCGNGVCEEGENCSSCENDCKCGDGKICGASGTCEEKPFWQLELVITGTFYRESDGYTQKTELDYGYGKIYGCPDPNSPSTYFSPVPLCVHPDTLSLETCTNGGDPKYCSFTATGQVYINCETLVNILGSNIKQWCESRPLQTHCKPDMDCGEGGVRVEFCVGDNEWCQANPQHRYIYKKTSE